MKVIELIRRLEQTDLDAEVDYDYMPNKNEMLSIVLDEINTVTSSSTKTVTLTFKPMKSSSKH